VGFIEPCLPSPAKVPPSGPDWIHEIKHDGFRIMARRDGGGVRLIARNGNDFTRRFPLGAAALALIRRARNHASVNLCAFDLLEIDGEDLRRVPIGQRKHRLARLLRSPPDGIALNEHFSGEGGVVLKHVCKLGCEGIVSKRLGSPYRSGRTAHWIKVKNPKAPAVKREADEDWR
jgi:bifunctional non-homologous end joining protein LigD